MIRAGILLAFGVLSGCAHEWRTDEPVTPSTYQAPSHRAAASVGRLGRLAVMPVWLHLETDGPERTEPAWRERRERLARELQASVADYLSTHKGYDTQIVAVPLAIGDAAVIRETGLRLGVDGIVLVERWITPPWSTAKAILNVFLLDIPLFQAMSAVNLRISIHETASGRLVWQQELKGEDSNTEVDLAGALGDLENAVPNQLRR